jgi:hypothetical protein
MEGPHFICITKLKKKNHVSLVCYSSIYAVSYSKIQLAQFCVGLKVSNIVKWVGNRKCYYVRHVSRQGTWWLIGR